MKIKLFLAFLLVILLGSSFTVIRYYKYIFARTVRGEIIGVERVTQPSTIIGSTEGIQPSQIFSFAVAIKDRSGEIYTGSSEDRQWAVAQKGQCAEAKFFPYPPWELEKSGTYHAVRLVRLFECPAQ